MACFLVRSLIDGHGDPFLRLFASTVRDSFDSHYHATTFLSSLFLSVEFMPFLCQVPSFQATEPFLNLNCKPQKSPARILAATRYIIAQCIAVSRIKKSNLNFVLFKDLGSLPPLCHCVIGKLTITLRRKNILHC